MINTAHSICRRSSYMFVNGCQESVREIARVPQTVCKAIYQIPQNLPSAKDVITGISVFCVSAGALSLYSPEFGLWMFEPALEAIKGAYALVLDPIHMIPIAVKSCMVLTAAAIISLAVGIILGTTVGIAIAGIHGFGRGAINGYYKN